MRLKLAAFTYSSLALLLLAACSASTSPQSSSDDLVTRGSKCGGSGPTEKKCDEELGVYCAKSTSSAFGVCTLCEGELPSRQATCP